MLMLQGQSWLVELITKYQANVDNTSSQLPTESAPQDLSNECQYVSTILNFGGQFVCPTLGDRSLKRNHAIFRL
jgi:hypothetical protein